MPATRYPFAVRLIGFAPAECAQLEAMLAHAPHAGPSYFCLHDDSLQEPDLYLADGDSLEARARLACLPPCALQPSLLIGGPGADACRTLSRPVNPALLYDALADLLDERVQALAALTARGECVSPERRRHPRLVPNCEPLDAYLPLRRGPPGGAVLIVDKEREFRDHVARVVGERKLAVEWTDSTRAAVRLCDETAVSLVMINTSAPGIDPYRLCSSIKAQDGAERTPVVFLIEQSFQYDSARAHQAGARGLLDKPVAGRHLMMTFRKLLDLPA
jgi:CheY-like chemotaxis protein